MNLTSKLMGIPLLTWVFLCACAQAWKLDCTKFVFAPRCRGVAAKRGGGDMTSYEGQKFRPEDTWVLYNRSPRLAVDVTGEVAPHPQGLSDPSIQDDSTVLHMLSKVLGLSGGERRTPYYPSDKRTNMDRIKVYFDALLQSLEDTAEDSLKEDVMRGEA